MSFAASQDFCVVRLLKDLVDRDISVRRDESSVEIAASFEAAVMRALCSLSMACAPFGPFAVR